MLVDNMELDDGARPVRELRRFSNGVQLTTQMIRLLSRHLGRQTLADILDLELEEITREMLAAYMETPAFEAGAEDVIRYD